MVLLKQIVLGILSYVFVSTALLAHPFWPLIFLLGWQDRLGIPHWEWFIALGAVVATIIVGWLWRFDRLRHHFVPVWVALWILATVLPITITADARREAALRAFAPDRSFSHSIWRSFREAPREFQFYLHAGAVNDCTGYGWSYREMAFYEIPPSANADPRIDKWLWACQHAP